jgi:hypothetical protein
MMKIEEVEVLRNKKRDFLDRLEKFIAVSHLNGARSAGLRAKVDWLYELRRQKSDEVNDVVESFMKSLESTRDMCGRAVEFLQGYKDVAQRTQETASAMMERGMIKMITDDDIGFNFSGDSFLLNWEKGVSMINDASEEFFYYILVLLFPAWVDPAITSGQMEIVRTFGASLARTRPSKHEEDRLLNPTDLSMAYVTDLSVSLENLTLEDLKSKYIASLVNSISDMERKMMEFRGQVADECKRLRELERTLQLAPLPEVPVPPAVESPTVPEPPAPQPPAV